MNTFQQTPGQATPSEIQEKFGIKRATYYSRIKYLGIEAHKDENGKTYLDSEQVKLFQEFHEYINETGKMEGFQPTVSGSLVKAEEVRISNIEAAETEDIYVEPQGATDNIDFDKLMRSAAELKAREVAMPALVKRALADGMSEEDLPEDLKQKVTMAREAANPKYTPVEVAATLLTQWRQSRLAG